MRKNIYLDYAAATYIEPAVLKKMQPYLGDFFGNASSLHSLGQISRTAIEKSRRETAGILGVLPEEIIFTGSGTESANLAVFGIARAYKKSGNHIIVSKIEHKAILESAKSLEKEGFDVIYLDVDKNGLVKLDELKKALNKKTILVSIMYANNEIGTIQPIAEISRIIKEFKSEIVFHTDACQIAGALPLDVKKLGVDALTLNGSKIYGPKGIGCLYLNKNIKIEPITVGGGQENNFRAGTENPALIVGFSEALKLAEKMRVEESRRLTILRDYLIKNVLKSIKGCRLNGDAKKRLPNNINFLFFGIDGEALVLRLDLYGIYASTGSACTSFDFAASHVLSALGIKKELIHGSLRLTLGRKTTKKDLDYVLKILVREVGDLRKMSAVK
ncbi:MAG: cysteine desulfurase family protein [Candidatus Paceibacterota bacterium]